jgi:hypothetical protein
VCNLVAHIEGRTWAEGFENRFGPKRDEVTGAEKLCNEELYPLHSLPNIIRVIKERRMRLTGLETHGRDRRGACGVLVGKLRERHFSKDPSIDGRRTLKCIFEKHGAWSGSIWLRTGTGGVLL